MPQVTSLDDHSITVDEARRFLAVAGAVSAFLRHDLSSDLQVVQNDLSLAELLLEPEAAENRDQHLLETVRRAARRFREVLRSFRHLIPTESQITWQFTTLLDDVAKAVMVDLPKGTVTVSELSPLSLRVLFPSNALYAVVYELARNAQAHASTSTIVLDWAMHSDSIRVSIHDSGDALNHLLVDRHLPLELIEPKLFEDKSRGLSIVRRIAHFAGGLLLARRSPILGGAEMSVQFPVTAFSIGEKKR